MIKTLKIRDQRDKILSGKLKFSNSKTATKKIEMNLWKKLQMDKKSMIMQDTLLRKRNRELMNSREYQN